MASTEADAVRVIAGKIRALRRARGMSGARLAEEVTRYGVPWERSTVAKLETNRRGSVSVAELFALGLALGVTPLALLVDLKAPHVDLAPGLRVLPYELLLWLTGERHLGPPKNLQIGEYRPPGLAWGEMQPDALLVASIERAWENIYHLRMQARPEPFGAPTPEGRARAAADLAESVAGMRVLLEVAGQAGIVVPSEIAAFVSARDDGEPR